MYFNQVVQVGLDINYSRFFKQECCSTVPLILYNDKAYYLSQESARTLVHAFRIGRIDYCNSLLFSLLSVHLLKLQRLQNAAARLLLYTY